MLNSFVRGNLRRWLPLMALAVVASATTLDAGAGRAQAARPLSFAKVPSDGNADMLITRYGPLVKTLSQSIGRDVAFQTRGSYDKVSEAMGQGAFDVVSAGPALYIQHERLYEPIVRPVRFGRAWYRGIVLVAANSRYRTLKDLKGARLGFVSEKSTSGYLLPALMLEQSGLSLDKDFKAVTFFHGKHPAVAKAVTQGDVDAGAVYDDARLDAYGENKAMIAKTRVLASTPIIANDPIVVRKSLPADVKARIRAFFMSASTRPDFKDLAGPLDEGIKGWVKAEAKDYDPVRGYISALEKAERGAP